MTSTTGTERSATTRVLDPVATAFATSRDGTRIGYRQVGHGPGIVLLHGAMQSGESHIELARALAGTFTVYLPDRRGRGLSGPFGSGYSLRKEVEDVEALVAATGAHDIFGVSAGGIVALQAALTLPAVERVAVFEPALSVVGSASTAFLARFDREIARGNVSAALVTAMKAAEMGPPIFNAIPRALLELLTRLMMAAEDRKATDGDVTMRRLAPTLHYDFQLVAETEGSIESYKAIRSSLLLLGGTKSPPYLTQAVQTLQKLVPQARRVELAGLGHGASGNRNRGGRPELVAAELLHFFA
jgi:pimeloyl-ACP methyl ester carboxylesterase